jgi:hypothetical protein
MRSVRGCLDISWIPGWSADLDWISSSDCQGFQDEEDAGCLSSDAGDPRSWHAAVVGLRPCSRGYRHRSCQRRGLFSHRHPRCHEDEVRSWLREMNVTSSRCLHGSGLSLGLAESGPLDAPSASLFRLHMGPETHGHHDYT